MTIGTSIVLIAVGAILKYAVTERDVGPLDIDVAGTILLILGILGLILALLYQFVWADRDRGVRRETYVEDVPPPRDRYGPRY